MSLANTTPQQLAAALGGGWSGAPASFSPNQITGIGAGAAGGLFKQAAPNAAGSQGTWNATVPGLQPGQYAQYDIGTGNVNVNQTVPSSANITQPGVTYSIDPTSGKYVMTGSTPSVNGDAGNWQDMLIQAGQCALACMRPWCGFRTGTDRRCDPCSAAQSAVRNICSLRRSGLSVHSRSGQLGLFCGGSGRAVLQCGDVLDNSWPGDHAFNTAQSNVAPQLAADQSSIANQGLAGITADATSGVPSSLTNNIRLAQGLLKLGQTIGAPGSLSKTPGQTGGMAGSGGVVAGGGQLIDNLSMMLQANAMAKMNGAPLPFPGLGGLGG